MLDGTMQDFPLTLDQFLRHAAKWHPDAEIVTAREGAEPSRIGYAALMDRCLAVSSILAGYGMRQGDRVATLAWNSQAHVEVWYAVMGMGAVCHTLNPRLTAEQLAAMLGQSEARILVASADQVGLARRVAALAPGIAHVLVIDGSAPDDWAMATSLEPLIETAPRDAQWGGFPETAPAGLCFTSGTTGSPKGVTYTHRSNFLHAAKLLQTDVMALSGRDRVLVAVPMFHASAWGMPFAMPAVGGGLILPGRHTDGASLARLIASEGVTIGAGVPTVWLGLVDHMEAVGGELPSLKRVIVGGSPLPPALMERIERRLGVIVQTTWGMTELSPAGTVAPIGDPVRNAALSGRPAVGVDLLLTDGDGVPLPEQRGVEGHLRVRGVAVIDRYFGQDRPATDAAGWFPTGDLARIDTAGNLMITGRAKDLIKSGGEWINPVEIEALVGSLPEVSLVAVIGRTHPKWGERPVLLVETRTPVSDEALLAPLKGKVASWWLPDEIIRLDNMPLAGTGKIDKTRLRALHGAG
ncbi:AMP-binding protein [Niveispirillum fermenti]|uniref:AMP-binding protein n=1 Tax=Niveispirillum fermenti TaxID=1233113 RepID=UPI003A8372B6